MRARGNSCHAHLNKNRELTPLSPLTRAVHARGCISCACDNAHAATARVRRFTSAPRRCLHSIILCKLYHFHCKNVFNLI